MAGGRSTVPRLSALKRIREAQFLTQDELAAASGVSRTWISRLERGDIDAHFSTIKALAAALNVPPAELVGDQEAER